MAAITVSGGGAVWWMFTRWRQVWCFCGVKTVRFWALQWCVSHEGALYKSTTFFVSWRLSSNSWCEWHTVHSRASPTISKLVLLRHTLREVLAPTTSSSPRADMRGCLWMSRRATTDCRRLALTGWRGVVWRMTDGYLQDCTSHDVLVTQHRIIISISSSSMYTSVATKTNTPQWLLSYRLSSVWPRCFVTFQAITKIPSRILYTRAAAKRSEEWAVS